MRLLLISDSPTLSTSYGNVVRHFAHAVSQLGVSVAFGSVQHSGVPLTFTHRDRSYSHFGCLPPYRITDAVREYNPDLVIHVRDPVVHIQRMYGVQTYSVRGQMANGAPCWTWVPVQEETAPRDHVQALHAEYDVVMPFTRAGAEALGRAGMVRDRLEPLQLGVSEAYSDPGGRVAFGYGREGVPVVMSVGLGHQDRKMFPLLMRAHREAVSADPVFDADYYLHTTMLGAFDLAEHAAILGVDGRWMFPRGYDPMTGYTEEELASRYRRAQVYASTGTGEGWDMPLSEACSLGLSVVFPQEPNRLEVTADYGGPKFPVRTFPIPRQMSWERVMDTVHLGKRLRQAIAAAADPVAGREYYRRHSWDTVAARFLEITKARGL